MIRVIAVILLLGSTELHAAVPQPCLDNPEHPSCNAIKINPKSNKNGAISVPEPAPVALIGLGLVGIGVLRRFKK